MCKYLMWSLKTVISKLIQMLLPLRVQISQVIQLTIWETLQLLLVSLLHCIIMYSMFTEVIVVLHTNDIFTEGF